MGGTSEQPGWPEPVDSLAAGQANRPRASVSRRRLLAGMGAVAAAAGAAGLGLPVLTAPATAAAKTNVDAPSMHPVSVDASLAKHQWVMVFDLRRCDGCGKCTEGCNKMHYLREDQPWIPIFKMKSSGGQEFFLPRPCMQCEDPPCTKVCPVTATYRVEDGVTVIDQNKCIGCRMCLAACPYQHRTFNWTQPLQPPTSMVATPEFNLPQKIGTAGKCDMCVHKTRVGEFPACVEWCGMDAVYIGDLETDTMTNGAETFRLSQYLKENDAFRLKEELNTRPRVYYVAGHGQDLEF